MASPDLVLVTNAPAAIKMTDIAATEIANQCSHLLKG
jgi:hypothetical protein